jgi:hypothetical protein
MARKQGLLGIMPEPAADVVAQVSAVANPLSSKTAAFMAPGTPVPRTVPAGTVKVTRPEGTLVTNSAQQANKFSKARKVTDAHVAKQLGYPETKAAAMKAGAPRVVQGRTASGAVAHESVASRAGTPAAIRAAAAAVPGGRVVVTSPRAVLLRRLGKRGT